MKALGPRWPRKLKPTRRERMMKRMGVVHFRACDAVLDAHGCVVRWASACRTQLWSAEPYAGPGIYSAFGSTAVPSEGEVWTWFDGKKAAPVDQKRLTWSW